MVARPIYSHLFIDQGPSVPGDYQYAIGVTGQVAVIRNMDFTAPTRVFLPQKGFAVSTLFGAVIWVMGAGVAWGSTSYHWRGRAVLPDSANLVVVTKDDGWSWNISGYLFSP